MVALAELTKIPIATLMFSAKWLWKPILALFLGALALITFGTVYTGLERASTLRQIEYSELQQQINVRRVEKADIEKSIADLLASKQIEKAQADMDLINQQWIAERNAIEKQIEKLDSQQSIPPALVPRHTNLLQQIKEVRASLDSIRAQRDKDLETKQRNFESQRDSYVKRIDDARKAGDTESVRKWEEQLLALPNPRRSVEDTYKGQLATAEVQLAALERELNELRASISRNDQQAAPVLKKAREALAQRLQEIKRQWETVLAAAREQFLTAQTQEANKQAIIADRRARLDTLSQEVSAMEKQRIPLARTDQVRRIAARVYGGLPENVTDQQVGFVAMIWFAALSALAALAGPLTAIVALGLQRVSEQREQSYESKLSRFLRKWLLRWRFSRTKSVKIPVEVEKPVEKIVEVPVEKVVKEILYVPILTDDPDAIRRALRESVPQEVADLVKISTMIKPDARPT
jgi:hypothetical protein